MAKTNEHLTKKDMRKLFCRFAFDYNRCGNFQNWHGTSYGYAMIPLLEEYYGVGTPEFVDGVMRHLDFHNQEPVTGSIIQGIMVGMEEQKALGYDVDPETIRATKSALMGPVAGIGDSLVQATLIPLLLTIAISLTGEAGSYSVFGPIFYMVAVFAILLVYGHFLFMKGYKLGRNAVETIAGSAITKIREAIQVFGVILVGGLSANYCAPKTILSFVAAEGAEPTMIQGIIDGIFPNLLGLGLVLLCYYLLAKKRVSTFLMIIILMAATIALAYLKII